MSQKLNTVIAVVGIDIGKNSFHIVGHDERGSIVLRQKWSRGQVEARFANMPPCQIGMEACVGDSFIDAYLAIRHEIDTELPAGPDRTLSFADFVVFAAATAKVRHDFICKRKMRF